MSKTRAESPVKESLPTTQFHLTVFIILMVHISSQQIKAQLQN